MTGADPLAPLFDPDFYARQTALAGAPLHEPPLAHYLRTADRAGFDPHPLIQTDHYLATRGEPPPGLTPLDLILSAGPDDLADPSPLFSVSHYRRQAGAVSTAEALRHYLAEGGAALIDPHPRFDARWYAATHPDCLNAGETPLGHYVRSWLGAGFRCPPWGTDFVRRYGGWREPAPYDAILVSHEFSLTGAPKILAKLCEHLARERGWNVLTLAAKGGPLLEVFAEWSDVFDLSADATIPPAAQARRLVASMTNWSRPRLAIVNTACVSEIGAILAGAGIPVTTLVHELASMFPRTDFERIYATSSRVIYPAAFVRDEAHRLYDLPAGKALVAPQGLLDPQFGRGDAGAARGKLLSEIGAPDDAFIVLGCGTLDQRKGLDLFVRVAAEIPDGVARQTHFVWLGDGNRRPHSTFWYAAQDVARLGLESRVHFVGARIDPEPYFLGCDALALTSRLDPFPCVVHEAMACSKPVVAFANAGGAPEALEGDSGFVVPYGDTAEMADVLRRLAADPALAAEVGGRARDRVRLAYRFFDYGEKVVATAEPVATPLTELDATRAKSRGRVVFARGGGDPDAFVERLAAGLSHRGFDVEIVVTDLRAAHTDAFNPPKAPYRFAAHALDDGIGLLGVCERLEYALRAAAPAIYAPDVDLAAGGVVPALGAGVGVLGLMLDDRPARVEQAVRLGPFWQRAVAATPAAAAAFANAVPDRASDLIEIFDDGGDLEAVIDSYVRLIEEMLAELHEGGRASPSAMSPHPTFGRYSLPADLSVGVGAGPEAAGPGRDWTPVLRLESGTPVEAFGDAEAAWREGRLEIDKAHGEAGVFLDLGDIASRQIRIRATVLAATQGVASLRSRTVAERTFTDHGANVRKIWPGVDRLDLEVTRNASLRGLRLCPTDAAGPLWIEDLVVYAPSGEPRVVPGEIIDFSQGRVADPFLAGGWWAPQPQVRWSYGAEGRLRFAIAGGGFRLWLLCRVAGARPEAEVRFDILGSGGEALDVWAFPNDRWRLMSTDLSKAVDPAGLAELALVSDGLARPIDLGLSKDARLVGLGVRAGAVFPADVDPHEIEGRFRGLVGKAPFETAPRRSP